MCPVVHFILPEGPQRGTKTVYRPVLPRGVLQLARAAEAAGWEAIVLDGYSAPHLIPAYLQILAQSRNGVGGAMAPPDVVGLSVHGPAAIEPALAIARRLREIEPSLPLLFGGQFANAAPEFLLPLLPERSILFAGDGDTAIVEILREVLEATGEAQLIRPPGIHPWKALPDLDLLLPGYADYFEEKDFEYHLETQIGCPYRCFHCGTGRKGLYSKTINRPIEAIQRELDQLVAWARRCDLPHPRLWITDETFGADPEHARAFCEALISRHEPWGWRAQSRADTISESLLETMRRAGCERIAFGVEIPNDVGLDLLGKREAMEAVTRAFGLCRDQKVSPEAIIVVGTPDDSTLPEEFLDALDMLKAGSVQAYIYHPIPGSPWWKMHGDGLRALPGALRRWSDLDFHSPPLDVSPIEAERTIVAFLALQLWRPESERRAIASPLLKKAKIQCSGCGRASQLVPIFSHPASQIEISRCNSDGKIYYAAVSPAETKVLELDPTQHCNLYLGLFSLDCQILGTSLCPLCLCDGARSSSRNSTEDANFFAI